MRQAIVRFVARLLGVEPQSYGVMIETSHGTVFAKSATVRPWKRNPVA